MIQNQGQHPMSSPPPHRDRVRTPSQFPFDKSPAFLSFPCHPAHGRCFPSSLTSECFQHCQNLGTVRITLAPALRPIGSWHFSVVVQSHSTFLCASSHQSLSFLLRWPQAFYPLPFIISSSLQFFQVLKIFNSQVEPSFLQLTATHHAQHYCTKFGRASVAYYLPL